MTFLILPSSRLAAYIAETNQLRILPVRSEEYLVAKNQMHNILVTSFLKTLKFYDPESLLKAENGNAIEPISSVQFSKKLQGLTVNKKGTFYVSDKFGDVYSVNKNEDQKYMNSNLGIPTLLKYVNVNSRHLMLVGDEQTRIKIYNEERMHEIISFWFMIKRVPLQLIQPKQDKLVLMVKKQNQVNIQMHEELDQLIELYVIGCEELEKPQMGGKLFCTSREKDEHGECRYQTITHSQSGDVYLLKLYNEKILVEIHKDFSLFKRFQISIEKDEWNHLHAEISSKGGKDLLILSYGKSSPIDEKEELSFQIKEMFQKQKYQICRLNKDEHVIVHEI